MVVVRMHNIHFSSQILVTDNYLLPLPDTNKITNNFTFCILKKVPNLLRTFMKHVLQITIVLSSPEIIKNPKTKQQHFWLPGL